MFLPSLICEIFGTGTQIRLYLLLCYVKRNVIPSMWGRWNSFHVTKCLWRLNVTKIKKVCTNKDIELFSNLNEYRKINCRQCLQNVPTLTCGVYCLIPMEICETFCRSRFASIREPVAMETCERSHSPCFHWGDANGSISHVRYWGTTRGCEKGLTSWNLNKCPIFCKQHPKLHFLDTNCLFWFKFYWGSNWQ